MRLINRIDQSLDERHDISPEAQYHEAYESWRQHDRLIWQTPTIAATIDGALIVSTFAIVRIWWVREVILGCALILTLVLTLALIKHRYFSEIEQGVLTALEKEHAQKYIQRTSTPGKNKEYWGRGASKPNWLTGPNWLRKRSAHVVFIVGMYLIDFLLLLLLYLNWAVLHC